MRKISYLLKRTGLTLVSALLLAAPATAQQTSAAYTPSAENLKARKDFANRRFGIFLHWGIYSLFAQGEWYLETGKLNGQEYEKVANAFYPHDFDADNWIKTFKDAGVKYICFTTRHHDSFSMWDTKQSDYNIMHTPYKKDIVKALADACHKEGMGLHLYYSHLDWRRTDYPIGRTGRHTGRELKPNYQTYFNFMNAQLTELLTNYGKIDAIWFDGYWDHDQDPVPFDWRVREQYDLIHRLQPACLVGNNHHLPPMAGEDIQLFERDVPGENEAGYSGENGVSETLPLETCQTMNGMWGYKVADQHYKSATTLIRLLARTASKGANLLMNIGPQPDGNLPKTAIERLHEMGAWLKANGEAIYGTDGVIYPQGGDSIVSTRNGQTFYMHILKNDVTRIDELPAGCKGKEAVVLTTGEKLRIKKVKGKKSIEGISVPKDCADFVIKVN